MKRALEFRSRGRAEFRRREECAKHRFDVAFAFRVRLGHGFDRRRWRFIGNEAHAKFRGDELRGAGVIRDDVEDAIKIAFAESGRDVVIEHALRAVVVRVFAEDDFAAVL